MSEELTKTKLLPIQGKDMDSIMQNLETGVAELFTSERYQEYLKTMAHLKIKMYIVIVMMECIVSNILCHNI